MVFYSLYFVCSCFNISLLQILNANVHICIRCAHHYIQFLTSYALNASTRLISVTSYLQTSCIELKNNVCVQSERNECLIINSSHREHQTLYCSICVLKWYIVRILNTSVTVCKTQGRVQKVLYFLVQ